jgi:glycosyltransferase involved in cell wall biosynthesis
MGGALAVLVPSLAETAPLVVAESAASGTTVVVNDIPSLRRMVEWMGVGIVAGDFKQWLDAVANLFESSLNSQQHEENKQKNRAASQMFHPTAVAAKYLDLYETVL